MRIRFDPRLFLLASPCWPSGWPGSWSAPSPACSSWPRWWPPCRPSTYAIARRLNGARGPAAALLTIGLLLALVGPLAAMVTVVVGQATEAVNWLGRAVHQEGLVGLIERLPESLRPLASELAERLPHGAKEFEAVLRARSAAAPSPRWAACSRPPAPCSPSSCSSSWPSSSCSPTAPASWTG